MNIFARWFKKKVDENAARFANEDYRNGYDWAAGHLLSGRSTPDDIEAMTSAGDYTTNFDRGVCAAAREWADQQGAR